MSQSQSRRVVITGLGVITPLGNTPESLWESIATGRSGVGPLRIVPHGALPVDHGAEAWQFSGAIEEFGPLDKQLVRTIKKGLKVMCREIQMGVAAANLAMVHAGLGTEQRDPDRTGVCYGSDYIMTTPDEFVLAMRSCVNERGEFEFGRWAQDGLNKVDPLWLLKYLPNMPASHIAIYNDLRGPNNSITLREAAANLAVGEAYCTILRGHADVMLAGATGTRIHPLRSVHVVLQEPLARGEGPPETLSRPFDLDRTGMVLGEGAACIVMETLEHAEHRGAHIYGEVIGHSSSTVMHLDRSDGRGQAIQNALQLALRSAGLSPADIGHVHAHGLGTVEADRAEAQAIAAVFGPGAVPVTAAKSYFGHLGAGSGLVELISSLISLEHGRAIPVLNHATRDPQCPVAVIKNTDQSPGRSVLNVNVSPQGQASAVIVQQLA